MLQKIFIRTVIVLPILLAWRCPLLLNRQRFLIFAANISLPVAGWTAAAAVDPRLIPVGFLAGLGFTFYLYFKWSKRAQVAYLKQDGSYA